MGTPRLFRVLITSAVALSLLLSACTLRTAPAHTPVASATSLPASATAPQPLDSPTPLPLGGLPQFTLPPIATHPPTSTPLPTATSSPTGTPLPTDTPLPTETPLPTATATPEEAVRFAVIGDYGDGSPAEEAVAKMIKKWKPDFIITVGDNNYPAGSAETIDRHIGKFYHDYIHPYNGQYGEGAETNRFFPALGNHDWMANGAQPYLDYFELPGNERYYAFTWGNVDFFAVDSDEHEPDGFRRDSVQAMWLKDELARSSSPWKVVYFHHPPFSSGLHGPSPWMDWPFEAWGATSVFSGHDHTYERLIEGTIPYFVDGLGGGAIYNFGSIAEGSLYRFNNDWGAILVEATSTQMRFQFVTRHGDLMDEYVQER